MLNVITNIYRHHTASYLYFFAAKSQVFSLYEYGGFKHVNTSMCSVCKFLVVRKHGKSYLLTGAAVHTNKHSMS